ncbi:alpha-hydroxy acid oxidase [Archangium primigenium]|uniref:alpha-hydroxy acid oxidase n=1 Tax=[Archangium] primigenium TaxID=2792470 RepID=UPI00195D5885|nr:alpha-hydroxy acid oxidase [Archangium primigenium]MBM7114477.1 alpha-hydroxy-acid oxidizing protein [Archangium primigenium]
MGAPGVESRDKTQPRPLCVQDYEALARARMEPSQWDYLQGGSDDEVTLRANREAFARLHLRPRVLVDVSRCELSTQVAGLSLNQPLLVAPMAYHRLVDPEGEVATARAAGALGIPLVVSTFASRTVEEVAAAATGPLWLQVYCFRRREATAALIRRAEAAGYQALVLTVDAPRIGRRERDMRNGFGLPPHVQAVNFTQELTATLSTRAQGHSGIALHAQEAFDTTMSWEVVEWVRSVSRLPLFLKGVLTGEDAARAAAVGVEGVIVSNHGGRQLDGTLAALDALPEVVRAVEGRCAVLMDGGIRRGTDVLKALALGARAVLVGRPVLWGLAAAGEPGVHHLLSLLREELELAMVLAGRPTVKDIDASLVYRP